MQLWSTKFWFGCLLPFAFCLSFSRAKARSIQSSSSLSSSLVSVSAHQWRGRLTAAHFKSQKHRLLVLVSFLVQSKSETVQQQLSVLTGLSPVASVKTEKLQQYHVLIFTLWGCVVFLMQNKNESVQQQLSILTGLSPGASVKRGKLQQRNAILRRTGFLEGPPKVSGVGGEIVLLFLLLLPLSFLFFSVPKSRVDDQDAKHTSTVIWHPCLTLQQAGPVDCSMCWQRVQAQQQCARSGCWNGVLGSLLQL